MTFITCNAQKLKFGPATKAYNGPNTIINVFMNTSIHTVVQLQILRGYKGFEKPPIQFKMLIFLQRIDWNFSLVLLKTSEVDLPLCKNEPPHTELTPCAKSRICPLSNPSNAEATFIQSTRTQRSLKNI